MSSINLTLSERWYNPFAFNKVVIMNSKSFENLKGILNIRLIENNIIYCSDFNIYIDDRLEDNVFLTQRTMKKFAVAYINFFDNDLITEVIEALDWKDALFKHSKLQNDYNWDRSAFGDTLSDAKNYSFNCDMMIDVIELE